jgi:hypothetical protein
LAFRLKEPAADEERNRLNRARLAFLQELSNAFQVMGKATDEKSRLDVFAVPITSERMIAFLSTPAARRIR